MINVPTFCAGVGELVRNDILKNYMEIIRTMKNLTTNKNVSILIVTLLSVSHYGLYAECLGQESERTVEIQPITILSGYISPVVINANNIGVEEISDFILDFSSSVDVSAVEMFMNTILFKDFDIISISSISWDNRQWLLQLFEPGPPESWTEFVHLQNGIRMEFDTLAIEMKQDR